MTNNFHDYADTKWQEDDKVIKYLMDHHYDYENLTIRELRQMGAQPGGQVNVEDVLYGLLETAEELERIQPANPLDYGAIYPWIASNSAPLMDNGQRMLLPAEKGKLSFIQMMDHMRERRAASWNGTFEDGDPVMYLYHNNADPSDPANYFEIKMYPDHLEYQVPHHPGYEGIEKWLKAFDKLLIQRHD